MTCAEWGHVLRPHSTPYWYVTVASHAVVS